MQFKVQGSSYTQPSAHSPSHSLCPTIYHQSMPASQKIIPTKIRGGGGWWWTKRSGKWAIRGFGFAHRMTLFTFCNVSEKFVQGEEVRIQNNQGLDIKNSKWEKTRERAVRLWRDLSWAGSPRCCVFQKSIRFCLLVRHLRSPSRRTKLRVRILVIVLLRVFLGWVTGDKKTKCKKRSRNHGS